MFSLVFAINQCPQNDIPPRGLNLFVQSNCSVEDLAARVVYTADSEVSNLNACESYFMHKIKRSSASEMPWLKLESSS